MSRSNPLSVFIIAGEASGDQLGAHLMDGFGAEGVSPRYRGIGGEMMQERGLTSAFDMSELSVMGLTEVLPRLPQLLRRIRETADAIIADPPDVLITIDSPDFCLRVARKVKAKLPNLKVVHYVAPSVWAWRPKRAAKMTKCVDHVLALLPFEPAYMEAAGMSCDFVGHPIATVPQASDAETSTFRADLGISDSAPLLCVLPGSRVGEVSRHSETFVEVLSSLKTQVPELEIVVPLAPAVADLVPGLFRNLEMTPHFIKTSADPSKKFTAFAAANAALAVSGTVSLELAAQSTPMVIAYDASPITKFIMKRAFLLDTATLVNIVSETKAVPEFIFDDFQSDKIAPAVLKILTDPPQSQSEAAKITMELLGRGNTDPGQRAAQSVLKFIQ